MGSRHQREREVGVFYCSTTCIIMSYKSVEMVALSFSIVAVKVDFLTVTGSLSCHNTKCESAVFTLNCITSTVPSRKQSTIFPEAVFPVVVIATVIGY